MAREVLSGGRPWIRRWWIVGSAALAAVAAAGLGARAVLTPPRITADSLPDVSIEGAEDVVVAKLASLADSVRTEPRSAAGWGRLGMTFDVHGFREDALVCYRQAARLNGDDFRWPYFSAIALQESGSPDAFEWFERARDVMPDYAPLLIRYGQALQSAGRTDEAVEVFQAALDLDGSPSHARLALARIALAENDLAASKDHLVRAAETDPSHGAVHRLLAEVYRRLGQSDSAALVMRRSRYLVDQPSFPDPVYGELLREGVSSRWRMVRGRVYLEQNRPDLAAEELTRALESRADADAHNDLGIALQRLGRFEEAVRHHRAALELRPRFPAALTNLGSALQELDRTDEAIAVTDSALRLDSSFAQAYFNLSLLHTRRGDHRRAIAALRAGMANVEDDPRIANRLAWMLATVPDAGLRDGESAVRLAEELCELTGYGVAEAVDVLAAAYAEVGRYGEAVTTAERATELALAAGRGELAASLERRKALYESGQPYRER